MGLSTLIIREIPFNSVQFLIYEWLKGTDYNNHSKRSKWQNMLNGAIAGGVSAFITTPFDVAKTRLMTQYSKDELQYKSLIQTINLIRQSEGMMKLLSGWKLRVLYNSVGGMIFFGTYEFFSEKLIKA